MHRGAGAGARRCPHRQASVFSNPFNPLRPHAVRQEHGRRGRIVRAHDAPLRQAGLRPRQRHRRRRRARGAWRRSSGAALSAACCISCAPTLPDPRTQPKLLIVAPMSGHYATLLRGTVDAFLPHHDVYITDWNDARMVPLAARPFRSRRLHRLSRRRCWSISAPGVHTIGVCQPAVPLIAAVALMEAARTIRDVPTSMTLMGGPIDTRRSPTAVNQLAERAASTGSAPIACRPCRFPIRASAATSIPAFCSSPASWR